MLENFSYYIVYLQGEKRQIQTLTKKKKLKKHTR